MPDDKKMFGVRLSKALIRQIRTAAAMADKKIPQWVEEALTAYLKTRKTA